MPVSVTAIAVLAAGRGSPVAGSDVPKAMLEVGGRPLVGWVLDAALASGLRPVVLVVGHRTRGMERSAPQGVTVVRARGWRDGRAGGLRSALEALDGWAQVGAVCVVRADQPRVGAGAYRSLAAAYDDGAPLAVATYGGARADPVLVGRSLWPEARRLPADEGIEALMRTHPVVEVPCEGTGAPTDIETIEDLAAVQSTWDQEMES